MLALSCRASDTAGAAVGRVTYRRHLMIRIAARATAGVATLLVFGLGAASASAGTMYPTDGTAPFTAISTATHTFSLNGGSAIVRSTSSTFNGSTSTPANSTAKVNPVYSSVTCQIAGTAFPGAVSTSGPWTITSTNSVSPFTGNITTSATTTITCGGLSGSVVVSSQTKPGLTGTNSGNNFVMGALVSGLNWTASGNMATILGPTGTGAYSSGGQTITAFGVNVM
jgi:hypothetical protein